MSSSASARASSSLARGRPRRDALRAAVPRVRPLPTPGISLCLAIREQQNQGYLPDGTTRLCARRRADPPLHGHVDLRRVHGDARDRAREGEPGGAARGRGALRVRPLDRPRRGDEHGEGDARLDVRRLRRGPGRPRRRDRLPSRRAPSGSSASTSPRSGWRLRRQHGATETMVGGPDTVERIVESTGGFGADYTFEATGNVGVMRQAVESARMGWGLCTVAGVAGKGETLDVVPRFLITGRRIAGSSFGGVKGRDQVPQLVERWLAGEIDVDVVPLAPPDARRGQPRLRVDGGAGRDQERDLRSHDRRARRASAVDVERLSRRRRATAATACSSTRTASRSRCSSRSRRASIDDHARPRDASPHGSRRRRRRAREALRRAGRRTAR